MNSLRCCQIPESHVCGPYILKEFAVRVCKLCRELALSSGGGPRHVSCAGRVNGMRLSRVPYFCFLLLEVRLASSRRHAAVFLELLPPVYRVVCVGSHATRVLLREFRKG